MALGTAYMTADGGGSSSKKKFDIDVSGIRNTLTNPSKRLQLQTQMDLQGFNGGSGSYPGASGSSLSGSSGRSGGSGGSSSGGSDSYSAESYSAPAFDWAAYYAELQRQAQERANAAYERNMERIASAYNSAYGSLSGNYDSTVNRLNAARDKSMSDVNADAENSLREAYINNMLSKKNLNQRLSAMGYNGGATESTMASLNNNYGNSRTGINQTLNDNIANLDATYGDNLASALQSFNSAKANLDLQRMQLEMQAENARQNAEASSMSGAMSIDGSYMSALQAALANQSNYTYNQSQATNDFVAGQAQQAASASEGANYSKYLAQAQLQASQGANANTIRNTLFNAVSNGDLDINSLYNILAQLRAA